MISQFLWVRNLETVFLGVSDYRSLMVTVRLSARSVVSPEGQTRGGSTSMFTHLVILLVSENLFPNSLMWVSPQHSLTT
jgi:carbon starvation protein CstA